MSTLGKKSDGKLLTNNAVLCNATFHDAGTLEFHVSVILQYKISQKLHDNETLNRKIQKKMKNSCNNHNNMQYICVFMYYILPETWE